MDDNFLGFKTTEDEGKESSLRGMLGQVILVGGLLLALIALIITFIWGFFHNRSVAMEERTVYLTIQKDGTWFTENAEFDSITVSNMEGHSISVPRAQASLVPSTTSDGYLLVNEPSGDCVWFAPCPETESSYMVMTPTKK